ncbi:MAG: PQQ-binding-like beta-propeller repeat protein [Gaiellaceae bacterium]
MLAFATLCVGCGGASHDWALPNADREGTRAAHGSSIDAHNVSQLRPAWSFTIPIEARDSGVATATPVVAREVVYLQDMESDVFALSLGDGHVLWRRVLHAGTPGPNGLALDGGAVFGSTDTTVFALSAKSGERRWARRILRSDESFVDVAPLAADGLVYSATTGYSIGTRGAIYALDADDGAVRWRFDTLRGDWPHPRQSGGGGVWQTPTLADGLLFAGTANPLPWGGTRTLPNGGAYAGRALWTDTLVALDARRGTVQWFDQVTPHDIRDLDFQNPPIVAGGLLIGSGKAGRVVAWDRETHRRVWSTAVGRHRNDKGPLPARPVSVCPGLLGGVETPSAVADGRVFVPVVDLCYPENATGIAATTFGRVDPATGTGALVALDEQTGRRAWQRRLPSPVFGCATVSRDVVFTSTYDGDVYAFAAADGRTLWRAHLQGGINACPAVSGDRLLVPVGIPRGRRGGRLVAFGLRK